MSVSPLRLPTFSRGLAVLVLLVLVAGERPAQGDVNVEREVASVAQEIAKYLRSKDIRTVGVGQFRSRSERQPSPGTAITKALIAELRKADFTISRDAPVEVRGDFEVGVDERSSHPVIRVNFDLQDKKSRAVMQSIERSIFGPETVGTLGGVSGNITPSSEETTQALDVVKNFDRPKVVVVDTPGVRGGPPASGPPPSPRTRVKTSEDSPYAVEILVNGRALPVEVRDGVPFVALAKDDTYEVRLINDSPFDAAIALSIDGLSLFTFSDLLNPKTGRPLYSRLVVLAKNSWPVKGWHRTDRQAYAFQVSEYARSEAGKAIQDASDPEIGTITATFGAAWPQGAKPPADEPRTRGVALGTSRGPVVNDVLVPKNYHFGVIRAMITVRYTKNGSG